MSLELICTELIEGAASQCSLDALTLPALVAQSAARAGARPAITAVDQVPISFEALANCFDGTAARLARLGISRTSRVGLVARNGPTAAIAVLSLMNACACAPLNPEYRRQEFERYIQSLRLNAIVFADAECADARLAAESCGIRIVEWTPRNENQLNDVDLQGIEQPSTAERLAPTPDDIALILFTSGTTAAPKVVALRHRQILAAASSMGEILRLTPDDCSLIIMPLFHIHGLSALFATLLTGGTAACPPPFAADRFFQWFGALRPTWFTGAAAIHQAILEESLAQRTVIDRGQLRFIRSASSAMPQQLIRKLQACFQVPFIEAYGMTEAAPQIASNRLPPHQRKLGSVGAAAGCEVSIVNETGQEVRPLIQGEVIVRGPNVVTTYESDGVENITGFIDGWLRTGDVGYLDDDGHLFVTGRLKEIINCGGEKISPREVEEVLASHDAVREAVCYGIPHPRLGETVGAAIVLNPDRSASPRELQAFARRQLADFKVPREITIVPEIPKDAGGKLKRLGLADRLKVVPQMNGTLSRPHGTGDGQRAQEFEFTLLAIWEELLGTSGIAQDEDFILLGGDSLLASRMLTAIRAQLGVVLTHLDLIEAPTFAELVCRIREMSDRTRPDNEVADIRPAHSRSDAPLSFSQEALWLADQMNPGNPAFNNYRVLQLRGPLDVGALRAAVTEVCRRHEILRSFFPESDGTPRQHVRDVSEGLLLVKDFSSVETDARRSRVRQEVRETILKPFDLAEGPVFRVVLFAVGQVEQNSEWWLVLVAHHILTDAWSMSLWLGEIAGRYNDVVNGNIFPQSASALQYADFAVWQRQQLDDRRRARLVEYWRRQLDGAPALIDLPTDFPRPPRMSFDGARHYVSVPSELVADLRVQSRESGGTLFASLLAAFEIALHLKSGSTDLVVGTHVAGRDRPETATLIGDFTNTVALRGNLAGHPPLREILARTRKTLAGALAHQDLPFGDLVESIQPARVPGRAPLIQVRFRLQHVPVANPNFASLEASFVEFDYGLVKAELGLELAENSTGLSGFLEFNTNLFRPETIENFWRMYLTVLDLIAHQPDLRLSAVATACKMTSESKPERRPMIGPKPAVTPNLLATSVTLDPRAFKRRPAASAGGGKPQTPPVTSSQPVPVIIEPADGNCDLVHWLKHHRQFAETRLADYGGLLFRGFQVHSASQLEEFLQAWSGDLLSYTHRSTPRHSVAGQIYSSTEYPATETIPQHNEMAYTRQWPRWIAFCCLQSALQGGATPISDSHKVYQRIAPRIRERFERHGLMYVRNFTSGIDLGWQDVFQTTDPQDVTTHCRGAGIDFEWLPGGGLRTRQVCQAAIYHPRTHTPVWFNQAHLFHVSSLRPEIREALLNEFREQELPRHVFFGDGSPIEDSLLQEIRGVIHEETIEFLWMNGDVLLLDNLWIAHGRKPFEGPRKVVVGMTQACRPIDETAGITGVQT